MVMYDMYGSLDMYGMCYLGNSLCFALMVFSLGELTKLCDYDFQFMFQVLQFSNERVRDNHSAYTCVFRNM